MLADGSRIARPGDARAAAEALAWYRKGAEANHCVSVRRMAKAYRNGELGLKADAAKAAEWEGRRAGCRRQ